jgi:hypothetical protein
VHAVAHVSPRGRESHATEADRGRPGACDSHNSHNSSCGDLHSRSLRVRCSLFPFLTSLLVVIGSSALSIGGARSLVRSSATNQRASCANLGAHDHHHSRSLINKFPFADRRVPVRRLWIGDCRIHVGSTGDVETCWGAPKGRRETPVMLCGGLRGLTARRSRFHLVWCGA